MAETKTLALTFLKKSFVCAAVASLIMFVPSLFRKIAAKEKTFYNVTEFDFEFSETGRVPGFETGLLFLI